jgi:hypothetical protein
VQYNSVRCPRTKLHIHNHQQRRRRLPPTPLRALLSSSTWYYIHPSPTHAQSHIISLLRPHRSRFIVRNIRYYY